MLRVNNPQTSIMKAEGSTETAWKSEGIGCKVLPCKLKDHQPHVS
jgi:hypothetical protein